MNYIYPLRENNKLLKLMSSTNSRPRTYNWNLKNLFDCDTNSIEIYRLIRRIKEKTNVFGIPLILPSNDNVI